MQIKTLDIVSFGKWNRKTIHLNEGLNLICGPNESGKTSVRMFVTYVLFGLDKNVRERYISKLDGQLGGRLHISRDGEVWIIERFSHRNRGHAVAYLNGEQVSDEALQQFYKGLNRSLYDSIFSFQARDLHAIRNKTSDDVGKVLFNLGLTGSDRIVTLENKLNKEAGDLYKKSGKNPILNVKINELKTLVKKMDETQANESKHQELRELLRSKHQERVTLEQEQKNLEQSKRHLERMLDSKNHIIHYQRLASDLQSENLITEFPPEAKDRYDEFKNKQINVQEQINVRKTRITKLENDRKSLESASKHQEYRGTLDSVDDLADEAKSQESHLKKLDEAIQEKQRVFNKLSSDTGLHYTANEFLALNTNQYTEDTWSRLAAEDKSLQEKTNENHLRLRSKEEEIDHLKDQHESIEEKLVSNEDKIQLENQKEQFKADQSTTELKKQLFQEKQQQQSTWKKMKATFQGIQWGLPIAFIGFLAVYIGMFFQASPIDWALTLVLFGLAIIGYFFGANQKRQIEEKLNATSNEDIQKTIDPKQLQSIEIQLKDQETFEKQLDQLTTKLDIAQNNHKEIVLEQEHLQNLSKQHREEMTSETGQYPFLKSIHPTHWTSLHQSITKAKELASELLKLQEEQEEMNEELNRKRKTGYAILQLHGVEEEAGRLWHQVKSLIDEERNILRDLTSIQKDVTSLQEEIAELNSRFEPYMNQWKELLTQANVSNEEEFLESLAKFNDYRDRKQKKDGSYEFIFQTFSEETEKVLAADYDWDTMETKLNDQSARLEEITNTINELIHENAQTQAIITNLEENGELSEMIHEKSILIEEIRQLSKNWAIRQMAYGYLKDTKDRYQNVYFPGIMEATSENFSRLTGDKYNNVQFATESETIIVSDRHGEWYEVTQLSEGTADQLYISLRLSLSKALQASADMPFLLDDAFVNFDGTRKKHMFSLLHEQALQQQIVYFTCDKNEWLENDEQAQIIDLDDQETLQSTKEELLT